MDRIAASLTQNGRSGMATTPYSAGYSADDLDVVFADQADLVEVLHALQQDLYYKGT